MNPLFILENIDKSKNSIDNLKKIFNFDDFIEITRSNTEIEIINCSYLSDQKLFKCNNLFQLLNYLFSKTNDLTVYRLNSPDFPLNRLLKTEIEENFDVRDYDYVLSTGSECNLNNYFLERFNKSFYKKLSGKKELSPIGYFNNKKHPRIGRHWLSLVLRNFYYSNHFEELFSSPICVSVNMVGTCNYTCRKCQYHSSEIVQRKKFDVMDFDKCKIVVNKLSKDFKDLQTIYPCISGEPLLHPDMVKIVDLIRSKGIHCGFTTNASMLSRQKSRELVKAGITSLAFSLDTTDKKKYEYLQYGGDLKTVEKNILDFKNEFLKHNNYFSATINFVVSEENENEKDIFLKKWKDHGFNVSFSNYCNIFDRNRPYKEEIEWGPQTRQPCWALWQAMYLNEEGRMISCGAMAKTLGLKENIFEMSAYDLWRCESMEKLRRQQLTGVKPGYCQEFNCWTSPMVTYSKQKNQTVTKSRFSTNYIYENKESSIREFLKFSKPKELIKSSILKTRDSIRNLIE